MICSVLSTTLRTSRREPIGGSSVLPLLQASMACIGLGQNSAFRRFAAQSHQVLYDLLITFRTLVHMDTGYSMTRAATSWVTMTGEGDIISCTKKDSLLYFYWYLYYPPF
jgi:hypothetical protein